jgi:CheY-like chemotaxis protein
MLVGELVCFHWSLNDPSSARKAEDNIMKRQVGFLSEPSLPKAALLCIDDDQEVLECEKAFLETFGYTVVTASSGPEGLKLAGLRSFDVVIVDYYMPEMSGQEFAIAMRRIRLLTPIIMLSGAVDVPEQALKVIDAFVPKSCLASRLLPAIELLCGSELCTLAVT